MSIRDAYNRWSATYDADRNLTRDLDRLVPREVLADVNCPAILELGCGTGKNTAFLAQIAAHVCSLDFSEGMLRQARAKAPGANVAFAIADLAQPWPCAAGSFELVVCNLVLEHIEGLPGIFLEAYGCLGAGGRFFVCELHPFRQYVGGKATFRHDGEEVAITAFVHHISDFLEAAEPAGFTLLSLKEWWHDTDEHAPPRLVSFLFEK